jgi:phosphatidate cytidylyltransferase
VSGELARRVAVAVVGIPLVLLCLVLGGWVLGGLIALAAALGAREFFALARLRGSEPFEVPGVIGAAGLVLLAVRFETSEALALAGGGVLIGLTLVLLAAAVWLRGPERSPLSSVAHTLTGVVYIGGTLAFVPVLRAMEVPGAAGVGAPLRPAAFVLLPLLVTWVGDSAAYFVGRAFGRRKLAARVSPGKTVEGALAGLVGAAGAGALMGWWIGQGGPAVGMPFVLNVWTVTGIGVVVGAAGQVGDLVESVLKRDAGVKDSGALLPGHGGALDRLDALFFAFPVCWALLVLVGVPT